MTEHSAILDTLPDDIRTVLKTLGLEPDFVRYACCPKCFAIYPPDPDNPADPFPHTCTFQETDRPVCGAILVSHQRYAADDEDGDVSHRYEPVLTYPYRKLESWLVSMLSRVGVAIQMKAAWKPSEGGIYKDVFDAPGVQDFLGPDGKTAFSVQTDHSVHLVFSLFVDWFNPFGNKKAGKTHSIGAIYLICMNLPPHLRYRPENIYLAGIIPGPHEPQLHQINHLLRPLIDELLVLWHRGMIVGNIPDSAPLLVRGAVIPLVCDLPALRKTAGFAGHSSAHFCSFCELHLNQMNDLDRPSWKRHSWEDHLRFAAEWRDAPTEKARKHLFDGHGIRWSELLRLDYWDPTRFAVVDAMHNLFLGELRHHCRDVWGINVKDKSSESKKLEPHDSERQRLELNKALNAILKLSINALKRLRKGYIVAIAELNGVVPKDGLLTKAAYGQALIEWVCFLSNYAAITDESLCRRGRMWVTSRFLLSSMKRP